MLTPKDILDAKEAVYPYLDENGMVTINKAGTETGDSLHHTGFFYGGVSELGAINGDEQSLFLAALAAVETEDHQLLRYRSERYNTRDQHVPAFFALWSLKFRKRAKVLFDRIDDTGPLYLTGKDINPFDHYLYFARCSGVEVAYWKRLICDFFHLIGCFLSWGTAKRKYKKMIRIGRPDAISPYSNWVLRYLRAWVAVKDQPTWMARVAWKYVKSKPNKEAFTWYFTKWTKWRDQPPIHLIWVKVIEKIESEDLS